MAQGSFQAAAVASSDFLKMAESFFVHIAQAPDTTCTVPDPAPPSPPEPAPLAAPGPAPPPLSPAQERELEKELEEAGDEQVEVVISDEETIALEACGDDTDAMSEVSIGNLEREATPPRQAAPKMAPGPPPAAVQPPPWRRLPPPPPPPSAAASPDVSLEDEYKIALDAERHLAGLLNLKWRQRGPPPDMVPGGRSKWRNQKWREGSQRWSNRGGKHREWYAKVYGGKAAQAAKARGKGIDAARCSDAASSSW